jgi:hypothetical protein
MSLHQLPISRQDAWSLDDEGERLSRAPSAPGSVGAWSRPPRFPMGRGLLGRCGRFHPERVSVSHADGAGGHELHGLAGRPVKPGRPMLYIG